MKNLIKSQFNFPKSLVAVGFVAVAGIAISGNALALEPAAAATANWSETYPVRYSDLDVSTISGAKTLYMRIRFAAETLCQSAATWGRKEGAACVNKAVDAAVVHVNLPSLSQYHQLRAQADRAGLVIAKAD